MGCTESSCNVVGGEVIDISVESQSFKSLPARAPNAPEPTSEVSQPRLDGNTASSTAEAEPNSAICEAPMTFEIQMQRRKGEKVGAVLGNSKAGAVVISIAEGGIVDQWNQNFPDRMVRPGFIVSEVNGKTGYWDVMQEMRKLGPVAVKISQPPATASADWFEKIADMAKSAESQVTKDALLLRLQPQDASDSSACKLSSLPCKKAGDCGVDQCAICLEDVAPHQTLVQLPCGHAFHPMCAGRWLEQTMKMASNKKQSCPLCCRQLACTAKGSACCTPEC